MNYIKSYVAEKPPFCKPIDFFYFSGSGLVNSNPNTISTGSNVVSSAQLGSLQQTEQIPLTYMGIQALPPTAVGSAYQTGAPSGPQYVVPVLTQQNFVPHTARLMPQIPATATVAAGIPAILTTQYELDGKHHIKNKCNVLRPLLIKTNYLKKKIKIREMSKPRPYEC